MRLIMVAIIHVLRIIRLLIIVGVFRNVSLEAEHCGGTCIQFIADA